MAGNWRVTSCNGGKGGFLFTDWQRGKEHLIVPGIGQREKVVKSASHFEESMVFVSSTKLTNW